MKKLLCIGTILLMLLASLTACYFPGESEEEPDKITVVDGYLVVNGVKTEHQLKTDDVIEVVDGYLVVNGVKTEYQVKECEHNWTTVTTSPTCTAGGYDTLTCDLCGESEIKNETPASEHSYADEYSYDNIYHWYACEGCDAVSEKLEHSSDASGNCASCGIPLSATNGVIYEISADNTYAEVVGYEGSSAVVKIADEYEGLPVKSIFEEAFYENESITSVIIPDSVTSIGFYAFYGCPNLSSVVIGSGVKSIEDHVFSGCSALTDVLIPDSVTSISDGAFQNCVSLTDIEIPSSVTSIGYHAFHGCTSLEFSSYDGCIYLGNKLNPYLALINASDELSSYKIHSDTVIIADYAFDDCLSLNDITLPDGLTHIGAYAFFNCTNLTSIAIPASVTHIEYWAFYHTSKLTDVYYSGSETQWKTIIIGISNSNLTNAALHYNEK